MADHGTVEPPSDHTSGTPIDLRDAHGMRGRSRWTRRRFMTLGLAGAAGVVVAGGAGYELIEHGVLPGKLRIDELFGACTVPSPPLRFDPVGPTRSGRFYS